MIRAMSTAATGMEAQQTKIDVIANNLANVNTTGFRKSYANFADLLYETVQAPGGTAGQGREIPNGVQIGHGVRLIDTQKSDAPGQLRNTENPLDMAIEGPGFFQVTLADGRLAYTRAGNFKTDSQGRLTTGDGNLLDPPITIPPDALGVTIGKDGTVGVRLAGQTQPTELGRIQLATFANTAGLMAAGSNLMLETNASGPARPGNAGTPEFGSLQQGFLEMSNVKVVEEMIDLIMGQRAYDANSRVIKASDEMLGETARLK